MGAKTIIIRYPLLIMSFVICAAMLASCDVSIEPGGAPETSVPYPNDLEEPVVISRGEDEAVVSSEDSDSMGEAGFHWKPKTGDSQLDRGEAFINQSELITMESYPPQFALLISGALPSPCHALRVEVEEPDDEDQVVVNLYSVVDPQEVCVQVLEEFEVNVPLGTPPPGTYLVILNGEEIGEIGYE